MKIYEELVERGLIAQVTSEDEIKELVNNGKATFYIGFDPTADSLHVGHFMALLLMKRLQMAGNKPIALLGGGTGMIGDPSGKSDLREIFRRSEGEKSQTYFVYFKVLRQSCGGKDPHSAADGVMGRCP